MEVIFGKTNYVIVDVNGKSETLGVPDKSSIRRVLLYKGTINVQTDEKVYKYGGYDQ